MGASQVSICSNASPDVGRPPHQRDGRADRPRAVGFEHLAAAAGLRAARAPVELRGQARSAAAETTAPAFDWDYQFTLPADYMRALSVGEAGAEADFKIESGKLLCNQNPAPAALHLAQR